MRLVSNWQSYDFSSLRTILVFAAPVPVPLIQEYAAGGVVVRQLYGLTECTGPATVIGPEEAVGRAGSCGKAFFHTEVKLVDDQGRETQPRELGEVVMRGGHIMKGYWQNEEATAEALRSGWLHTGDIAYRDEDGFLYIADRKKDMIISGGENIYPAEIESVIASTSTRTRGPTSWPGTATWRALPACAAGIARCRSRSRRSGRTRW